MWLVLNQHVFRKACFLGSPRKHTWRQREVRLGISSVMY
jgi:hypothetical protein